MQYFVRTDRALKSTCSIKERETRLYYQTPQRIIPIAFIRRLGGMNSLTVYYYMHINKLHEMYIVNQIMLERGRGGRQTTSVFVVGEFTFSQ